MKSFHPPPPWKSCIQGSTIRWLACDVRGENLVTCNIHPLSGAQYLHHKEGAPFSWPPNPPMIHLTHTTAPSHTFCMAWHTQFDSHPFVTFILKRKKKYYKNMFKTINFEGHTSKGLGLRMIGWYWFLPKRRSWKDLPIPPHQPRMPCI